MQRVSTFPPACQSVADDIDAVAGSATAPRASAPPVGRQAMEMIAIGSSPRDGNDAAAASTALSDYSLRPDTTV